VTKSSSAFSLTKWYLDCVDAAGRTVVGYWATLAWRGLSLTWQSVDLCDADRPPVHRWSIRPSSPPQPNPERIRWQAPAIGCAVTVEPRQSSFAVRLLDDAPGTVDWTVESPVGRVTAEIDGAGVICGDGYVERLELRVPPWRLPITELRWGRCISSEAARSLVWIDWRGPAPNRWVVRDGQLATGSAVSDSAVSGDGFDLNLAPKRRLVHRALAELLEPLPPVRALLPESFLALSETKWLGSARLQEGASPPLTLPAVYEVVRMGVSPRST
jgi:hypothetical protein